MSTSQPLDPCLAYRLDVKSLLKSLRDPDQKIQTKVTKCLIDGVFTLLYENYGRYVENPIENAKKKEANDQAFSTFLFFVDSDAKAIPQRDYKTLVSYIVETFFIDKYYMLNLEYYKKNSAVFSKDILQKKSLAIQCLQDLLRPKVRKLKIVVLNQMDADTIEEICQEAIIALVNENNFSSTYIDKKSGEEKISSPIQYAVKTANYKAANILREKFKRKETTFPDYEIDEDGNEVIAESDEANISNIDEENTTTLEGELGKIPEVERKNAAIKACFRAATPRQQEALQLKLFEGMDYEEIAEIMEISIKAAVNLISGGLKSIRECMNNKGFKR